MTRTVALDGAAAYKPPLPRGRPRNPASKKPRNPVPKKPRKTTAKKPSRASSSSPVEDKSNDARKRKAALRARIKPIAQGVLDMVELLNDLANFVGVGTIDITMPRRAAAGMEAPDGWCWLDVPEAKYPKGTLEFYLDELVYHKAIRCTYKMSGPSTAKVRVYLLPDDVGRGILMRSPSKDTAMKRSLRKLMSLIDVSKLGWAGKPSVKSVPLAESEDDQSSLFYMFNTMPSPRPDPDAPWIKDSNVPDLMREVLSPGVMPGLKTELYQYQKRSVAMIIQREMAPFRVPDSRLREMFAPSGEVYYLDFEAMCFYQEPSYFDDICGGILAEEMGTGKTLICLALILATQFQLPYIPPEYDLDGPLNKSAPTLVDACIKTAWRNSLPIGKYKEVLGDRLWAMVMAKRASYEVSESDNRARSSRSASTLTKEKVYLGSGTLVILPDNLVEQWRAEITKHVEPGRLNVLVMAHSSSMIPPVEVLLKYDIVIFSRARFDQEERAGKDSQGRKASNGIALKCGCPYIGATRKRDCTCFNENFVYKSPLYSIRWKRILVDEGHSLGASSRATSVLVAEKLPVERRWIVSGTPSSGLLGVSSGITAKDNESEAEFKERKELILAANKESKVKEDEDLDRLGRIVRDFLRVQPWTSGGTRGEQASWSTYITKGFTDRHPGATTCVRNILGRLMVRHRQEDVEQVVSLPPLYHRTVLLKPGYFEKLSMNLFLAALATNAVTSERSDEDYMFHPENRGSLRILTNNLLRQGGFFWTGYKSGDVKSTVMVGHSYQWRNSDILSPGDKMLLEKAEAAGGAALASSNWLKVVDGDDMGYFLSNLDPDVVHAWTVNCEFQDKVPMLEGTHVLKMQKYINKNGYIADPVAGLQAAGLKTVQLWDEEKYRRSSRKLKTNRRGTQAKVKRSRGVPESYLKENSAATGHKQLHSSGLFVDDSSQKATALASTSSPNSKSISSAAPAVKSILKTTKVAEGALPEDSPLTRAELAGTTSVKLSYLLSQIRKYCREEKILVFYETEDVAWYIAQGLEIMGIEYLAYQKNLTGQIKASYLATFMYSSKVQVMLMDLSQAAHGLNLACASRMFFINPVWQANVEAQALKRAHRIGQTRPVYVETLVLEGTLEEELLKRRNSMSEQELRASKDSADDGKMRTIIQNLQFLPLDAGELIGQAGPQQIALLETPEPLFGADKCGGILEDPGADINLLTRHDGHNPDRRSPAPPKPKAPANASVSPVKPPKTAPTNNSRAPSPPVTSDLGLPSVRFAPPSPKRKRVRPPHADDDIPRLPRSPKKMRLEPSFPSTSPPPPLPASSVKPTIMSIFGATGPATVPTVPPPPDPPAPIKSTINSIFGEAPTTAAPTVPEPPPAPFSPSFRKLNGGGFSSAVSNSGIPGIFGQSSGSSFSSSASPTSSLSSALSPLSPTTGSPPPPAPSAGQPSRKRKVGFADEAEEVVGESPPRKKMVRFG